MTVNSPICGSDNSSPPPSKQRLGSCDIHSVLNKQVIPNTLIPYVKRQAMIDAANHVQILSRSVLIGLYASLKLSLSRCELQRQNL